VQELFGALPGRFALEEAPRFAIPHARELRVEWSDGRRWRLRLDQGVGFWRAAVRTPFPFDAFPAEQASTLRRYRGRVCGASPEHPTVLYIGRLEAK